LKLISKELIEKVIEKKKQRFALFRALTCHELPLTNCAFNKSGDKYIDYLKLDLLLEAMIKLAEFGIPNQEKVS